MKIATMVDTSGKKPKSLFGYDVIDFIGEGAGSIIYAVNDPQTLQVYALKHIVIHNKKDQRFFEQLQSEFEISHQFTDPRLRKTFELKVRKTMLFKVAEAALVMELFDGTSLEDKRPEKMEDLIRVFTEAAKGLEAMHAMDYVHCDLKPNNILVSLSGNVKVIDFGQACRIGTLKQRIQGTPDYISPEQVRREPITPLTDVFNLGASMYWSFGNQKLPTLFTIQKSENSFLVDENIPSPHEQNSSVPDELSKLVMECVRSAPEKRPTMNQVIKRLEYVAKYLNE